MKKAGAILVLLTTAACGHRQAVPTAPPTVASSSNSNYATAVAKNDTSGVDLIDTSSVLDSLLGRKIDEKLRSLVEIRDMMKDHVHGKQFSYLLEKPDDTEPDYVLQVGYEDTVHFQTHYWIHITPKTFKIRFYDVVTDSLYDVDAYRALQKRNNK